MLVAVLGFGIAFGTHSPGTLAIGLVVGFVGLFGTVFVMVAERVAATARPDSALLTDKDISALRANLRKAKDKTAAESSPSTPDS